MGNPVVHLEIGCRDSEKAQKFYRELFEWKIAVQGPAAIIAAEAGGIAGHITAMGHEPHHYTIFYVQVEDVAAYPKKGRGDGRANADTSRGNSHGHICVAEGFGWECCGIVEAEGESGPRRGSGYCFVKQKRLPKQAAPAHDKQMWAP